MKCFSPCSIPDPRASDPKIRITVPCGKCAACLTNKRNDWATRLRIEARYSKTAYFVTLTYSEENVILAGIPNKNNVIISQVPTLVKADVQKFIKRLRKGITEKIRYFIVGEYGSKTWRPHYHMLLFGLEKTGVRLEKYLLEKWNKGIIDIGTVSPASIRYCTNYMIQKQGFQNPYVETPFSLMSKGIGLEYVKRHEKSHHQDLLRNYVTFEDGQKSRLPRYFREKLYCENTRIKQNEHYLELADKEELTNVEKWARKNLGKNRFEYEYEQHKDYTKKVEKKLKTNSKL